MAIEIKPRKVKFFFEKNNKSPLQEWLASLKDMRGKAKLLGRINRSEQGHFGEHRNLKDGIWELKEDFGPGYRIYFGLDENDTVILLLAGGSKGNQASDIAKAKELWQSHKRGK